MKGVGPALEAAWHAALDGRVARASWSVSEGGRVLCAQAPARWYSSASMIKTFVVAAALEAVEDGTLRLEAPVEVAPRDRAGGDGVLGSFALPVTLPLRELARLTLAISDNTATNAVLAALGGPEPLNARVAAWGFASRMTGAVGGGGARWSGAAALKAQPHDVLSPIGLGMTSVAEHQRLVAEVAAGTRLPECGGTLLDLLAQQQDREMLARFVGDGVSFAHKTGSIAGVRHDAGLLRAGDRELMVGCFTDGGPEREWVDHPAAVGMGLALAWTAEILGIDVDPPPGVPPFPATGAGGAG